MITEQITWWTFEEKQPDAGLCIIVYYEEERLGGIVCESGYEFYEGKLFNENGEEVEIKKGMLWTTWPDPFKYGVD